MAKKRHVESRDTTQSHRHHMMPEMQMRNGSVPHSGTDANSVRTPQLRSREDHLRACWGATGEPGAPRTDSRRFSSPSMCGDHYRESIPIAPRRLFFFDE
eukprot:CAMPEP_0169077286 /NCGR_PEP_ID=MMETSP1015-20121227/8796_1 /TAXON_ID=342587 /ORGANISM="Karlodinium micrum, Strain CCMP2283" /LENGTH=99 /DNA_ID=CAMNT_0009136797 /DNA_START=36 /DNA_END=335 /DNA_ORIENTATION=+